MDCKTAQLLLDYARPLGTELAAEDTHALEDHLTLCPDCGALARNERRVDEHLGKAMRAVEVPDRLRNHLLTKLDAERADWYRQRFGRILKPVAALAACLLLAVGVAAGWWAYSYNTRPAPDIELFTHNLFETKVVPRDRAGVEKDLREQYGVTVLPDFDYHYLTAYGTAKFQGVKVPQLVFNLRGDENLPANEHAVVYVLSSRQFQLADLPDSDQAVSGSETKVAVKHQPGGSFAYVIVYTGKDYEWLKNKP